MDGSSIETPGPNGVLAELGRWPFELLSVGHGGIPPGSYCRLRHNQQSYGYKHP